MVGEAVQKLFSGFQLILSKQKLFRMSTGCQKDRKTDRLTERLTDRHTDRKTFQVSYQNITCSECQQECQNRKNIGPAPNWGRG